jgi:hypothetical protein
VSLLDWFEPRELDLFPTPEARREAELRLPLPVRWIVNVAMCAGVFIGLLAVWDVFPHSAFGRLRPVAKWIFALLASLTGGLVTLALTVLSRRRRARQCRILLCEAGIPVCLHCGYDLRGQTEARCPECGRAFERPKLGGGELGAEDTPTAQTIKPPGPTDDIAA